MQSTFESENAFVVDLLTTLRHEKFSPKAWGRFLARSWWMSWQTAQAHPTLKRSWARVTMLIGSLAIAIIAASVFFEGWASTLRLLPAFLFCAAWQQSDLFWHLGLNRQNRITPPVLLSGSEASVALTDDGQGDTSLPLSRIDSGPNREQGRQAILLPTVGIASTFTWLRGLAACYLIGRLVGGLATANGLALLVFLAGIITDILDGQVARYTHTSSKLGQIADGEADFCLYLSITLILIQNGVLPLWLGLVMLLRFCIPLLAALGSYFLLAHPVRFGSTSWGKYAGLAQCLYLLLLLAPPQLAFFARLINLPLLIITLALLIIAPGAQIVANVRAEK
jgi:phosphatidylglycerophosphate synthase